MSNAKNIDYTGVKTATTEKVATIEKPAVELSDQEILLIWHMTEKYAVPGAGVELMAGLRAKLRPTVIEAQKAVQSGGGK